MTVNLNPSYQKPVGLAFQRLKKGPLGVRQNAPLKIMLNCSISCAASLNMLVLSGTTTLRTGSMVLKAQYDHHQHRKPPKNLRYPRRTKLPPDSCIHSNPFPDDIVRDHETLPAAADDDVDDGDDGDDGCVNDDGEIVWQQDEIEAISSLFQGRIPQKPGNLERRRYFPLPVPHKKTFIGLPTQKRISRRALGLSRQSVSNQFYKSPAFLVGLAKEIKALPPEENHVSSVLETWAQFLCKGSLSMTVRELGHMGLPERALLVFCWVQKQPHLYPDDRILASTVEVLARSHELKMPFKLHDDRFMNMVSQGVYEAIVKGFIRGGRLNAAWKLLSAARRSNRFVSSGVYAKLILELGKNPDKESQVMQLLEELAGREDLNLNPQDCTAVMKTCIRLGKFEIVEGLYDWFNKSGRAPSVVMYTTVIHSRYCEKRYREALSVVWEMEASNCLFDLPAYRVAIRLFAALDDLPRAVRYFAKLKEAGFSPTFDLYMYIIQMYMASGRIAKCKEMWLEAEMAGLKLDGQIRSQLFELGK